MRQYFFPKQHLVLLLLLSAATLGYSQQTDTVPKDSSFWKFQISGGLDIGQLLVVNPRLGSGINFVNLGGNLGFSAKYDSDMMFWFNRLGWQFGVQRIGSGTLPNGDPIPFAKGVDLLKLNSTVGKRIKPGSEFYYGGIFRFLSQVVPTYQGNLLEDTSPDKSGRHISKFFSPARFEIAPGIAYLAENKKLNIVYCPLAYKTIIVLDDSIAVLGVHGNDVEIVNNKVISYGGSDDQLGSLLNIFYTDNYAKKKVQFTTQLGIFSNYLNHPERIDVDLEAEVGFRLFKPLSLTLKTTLFYDYDVKVQKSDADKPVSQWETGRGVSFTEQIFLKYSVAF